MSALGVNPYTCADIRSERIDALVTENDALVADNAALRAELAKVRADLGALLRDRAGMRPGPGWRAGP